MDINWTLVIAGMIMLAVAVLKMVLRKRTHNPPSRPDQIEWFIEQGHRSVKR